jgi:hypothetical protein
VSCGVADALEGGDFLRHAVHAAPLNAHASIEHNIKSPALRKPGRLSPDKRKMGELIR